MTYSEQLEREAEQTRLKLAGTLDELRASLSPGHVVDQLVSYTSDGAGKEFLHNLKRQTVNNPLPVALIGAGLAWLALSSTTKSGATIGRRHLDDLGDAAGATLHDTSDVAAQAGSGVASGVTGDKDRVGATLSGLGDAAVSGVDSVQGAAAMGADRVRDAASSASASFADAVTSTRDAATSTYDAATRATTTIGVSATKAGRNAASASRSLAEFATEQPLVLAGLGLALGATLGALLPATEAENELMGEASDGLKGRAQKAATETYGKAAAVTERAVEAAKDAAREEAEQQGMTPELEGGFDSAAEEDAVATGTGDQSQDAGAVKERSWKAASGNDHTTLLQHEEAPTLIGGHESTWSEGKPRK